MNIKSVILIAWFFAFQHPIPSIEGAKVVGIVGPFAAEGECEAVRQELIGFEFPGFAASKCIDRKEA